MAWGRFHRKKGEAGDGLEKDTGQTDIRGTTARLSGFIPLQRQNYCVLFFRNLQVFFFFFLWKLNMNMTKSESDDENEANSSQRIHAAAI